MILNGLDLFMDLLMKSEYTVALTGAGLSTTAGISDFRGPNGLYNRKDIPGDKLFDIAAFKEDPSLFYRFIPELFGQINTAEPTAGHQLLAKLEKLGKIKTVVTQNIDGLHTRAGNKNVIELHGSMDRFVCTGCQKEFTRESPEDASIREKALKGEVPYCPTCHASVKPAIVFFGEYVRDLEKAMTEVQKADLLIVMGSSLTVYPAGMLPGYLHDQAKLVIMNMQETPYDHKAKVLLREPIDEVVAKTRLL